MVDGYMDDGWMNDGWMEGWTSSSNSEKAKCAA